MELEERKKREIEHSDRRRSIVRAYEYKTDADDSQAETEFVSEDSQEYEQHFSNMKFYSITRKSSKRRDHLLYRDIEGKVALDYCCGNGEIAVEMALHGAKEVYGIDLSPVAVENANALAASRGVGDRCVFQVMDAEKTEFHDDQFDVIHEFGALHHLDIAAAYRELARVLKADGVFVCVETMRHNPFIHWYRKSTPHLRTAWEVEHILGVPELMEAREHFGEVAVRIFHLASLAAVPFRKTIFFTVILRILEGVDSVLLALPGVRRWGWLAVTKMEKPRASD